MAIQVEVWGNYACFTRPEMKVERVSYDVMTPSAARGIIEAVYWHPGLHWHIDRIHVLSPICFTNIRRNEVQSKVSSANIRAVMNGKGKALYLNTKSDIQQRAALVLKNVHYVIEAHFVLTDKAVPSDNAGKFQDTICRRLEKGQCFHQPYFGCREFPASFRAWNGQQIPAIAEDRDLGYMLYDMDYTDLKDIKPMFFRAQLKQGILDLQDCEVKK